MNVYRSAAIAISLFLVAASQAGNPFLDTRNDTPVAANFRGTEWGEEIGQEDIPLSARVITTRIAKMSWGSIFKIEFSDLKSRAQKRREIQPEYFIATDDRIVLLNEENNDAAAKKISAMEKPPEFDPGNVYGITSGKFAHEEGLWTTTIELKGDQCVFLSSHNSGHFKKIVWKKGVGLIEHAMGYGARADGFRLRRQK